MKCDQCRKKAPNFFELIDHRIVCESCLIPHLPFLMNTNNFDLSLAKSRTKKGEHRTDIDHQVTNISTFPAQFLMRNEDDVDRVVFQIIQYELAELICALSPTSIVRCGFDTVKDKIRVFLKKKQPCIPECIANYSLLISNPEYISSLSSTPRSAIAPDQIFAQLRSNFHAALYNYRKNSK